MTATQEQLEKDWEIIERFDPKGSLHEFDDPVFTQALDRFLAWQRAETAEKERERARREIEQELEAEHQARFERFCAEAAAELEAHIQAGLEADKRRQNAPPPAITASGWPNLYPWSMFFTAFAIFAFFFLPPEIGGKAVAFVIVWWLFILPALVILTGFNVWQPYPDDPAPKA